jgi:2-oxoglutarate dehydrogenase E1 component
VYYDLLQKRRDESVKNCAIIRIEQLYPFPKQNLAKELDKYKNAGEVVWCQEEPQNQGVWFSSQHNIKNSLREDQSLSYAGRKFAAAPAVGSPKLHAQQQEELVKDALGLS